MTTTPRRCPPRRDAPDPRAAEQPGGARQLLQADGGTVRAGAVAKRLGVPTPLVEQLRQGGHLLAVPSDHGYHYPVWQFEGRTSLASLPTVLRALTAQDPWQQLGFLLLPHPALAGRRPLDCLRDGALDEVLRLIRAAGRPA